MEPKNGRLTWSSSIDNSRHGVYRVRVGDWSPERIVFEDYDKNENGKLVSLLATSKEHELSNQDISLDLKWTTITGMFVAPDLFVGTWKNIDGTYGGEGDFMLRKLDEPKVL